MIVRSLAIALALGAGACASAPKDLKFDRTHNALLILSAPINGSQNIDEFRRVDLASNAFMAGGYVRVETNTAGTFDTEPNQINANMARSVALSVREVPAGEYARQKSTRTAGININGMWGEVCFSQLAPVYSLAAGEVAIIRVDETNLAGLSGQWREPKDAASDATIMDDFERARVGYPNIQGAATIKTPAAYVHWPSKGDCELSDTFERMVPEMARKLLK